MRVKVLGCYGGELPGFRLPSFLIDDILLVDAGSVSASLSLQEQAQIDHILITHAHLNHTAGLAFLSDNIFGLRKKPVMIYSIEAVLEGLKAHLFNDILWPDFTQLPSSSSPTLRFQAIPEKVPSLIGEHHVTPVRVHHVVDAVAYFIKRGGETILYTGDTGPTQEVWEMARSVQNLKGIIVETSFPNRLQEVAGASGHLTPHDLSKELLKVDSQIPVYIYHSKPEFLDEIAEEIKELQHSPIQLLEQGRVYRF